MVADSYLLTGADGLPHQKGLGSPHPQAMGARRGTRAQLYTTDTPGFGAQL